MKVEASQFGQLTLTCDARGMLRLDATGLERVNSQAGVLLLTAEAERPVDAGTPVGVVKSAPLFLPEAVLAAVDAIRSELGPVIEVEGFRPHRAAFVAPRERLRGRANGANGKRLLGKPRGDRRTSGAVKRRGGQLPRRKRS